MSHFSAADVHLGHLGILTYSNASYSVRAQKGSIFCPRAHQQRLVGVLPLSNTISPRWRLYWSVQETYIYPVAPQICIKEQNTL